MQSQGFKSDNCANHVQPSVEKQPLCCSVPLITRSQDLPYPLPSLSVRVVTVRFRRIVQPRCCTRVRPLSALHVGHAATAKGQSVNGSNGRKFLKAVSRLGQ